MSPLARLINATETVSWERNTGTARPKMNQIDELTDASEAFMRWFREFVGKDTYKALVNE